MTNRLAICSMFRDSQEWYGRQINQVERFFDSLSAQYGNNVDVTYYVVEGNSRDNTMEALAAQSNKHNVVIFKKDIEGSEVRSTEDEVRFKNLSLLGNITLNAAKADKQDLILWMESDLIAPPNLISGLVESTTLQNRHFQFNDAIAVAPVPVVGEAFYDTWAFEALGGRRYKNNDLDKFISDTRYMQVNSIGTCALLNGYNLRKYNIDFGERCFPELCRQGRNKGLSVWCDTSLRITHPSSSNIEGRLI